MQCSLRVVFLASFAAFGGFMFGYDIGVINGVKDMDGFRTTVNLSLVNASNDTNSSTSCGGSDEAEQAVLGLIVSVFSLGCFVGALVAGGLADTIGRKFAVIVGGVVFFIGGAVQGGTIALWMVILGRVIAGIGVGILSMVVPVYNAEVSPKALRGRLVSLNQLFITAGIMVSFLMNLAIASYEDGWRVSLGIQCLLAVILIVGMLFLPETPRWLVKQGKSDKAWRVLTALRQGSNEAEVNEELADIKLTVKNHRSFSLRDLKRNLLQWGVVERITLGMLLQLFQQFTGMNVLMYYSTSIFCTIEVSSYVATAILGTINFLTTLLAIFLVDKVGRKWLLLSGALGMLVSVLLAATLLHVFDVSEHRVVGYVVAVLLCFFVFSFAYSWGPVAWVVTSEIFPLKIRGIAVSLTTSANWIGNFVVAMATPILLGSSLGTSGTFYILGGLLLLALLFVLFTLPETKGESLERVEQLFKKPWLQRVRIFYYLSFGFPWSCLRRDQHDISQQPPKDQDSRTDFNNDQEDRSLLADDHEQESELSHQLS